MRVLFISNLFPDAEQPWRGLDNVTLLHAMRALRPEVDFRVLCLRPGHGFWLNKACLLKPRTSDEVLQPSYHWAPYVPKFGGLNDRLFSWAVERALRSLPNDWRPEALVVPWLFPDASGVHRCQSLRHIPLLTVAQGSDVHRYLHMPMRRRAILQLAKRASIITRSEDLRQRLLKAGAESQHVHTVYNGVDTSTFHPGDREEARRALKLPLEGKIALFVGNFVPVKGLDLLIEACGRAQAQMQDRLHLVLIGSGPLESKLLPWAAAAGLETSQIIIAGRQPPAEVAQFMRAADAVCLSSHNEGVPNVLLETLASGRPLVSTQVGGIAEIIDLSPSGGFLSPGRDASVYAQCLLQALTTPPDPAALKTFAAHYSWDKCAQIYLALLDNFRSSAI
jgi:glycosyltransferase involved in cell wall biosynthesis